MTFEKQCVEKKDCREIATSRKWVVEQNLSRNRTWIQKSTPSFPLHCTFLFCGGREECAGRGKERGEEIYFPWPFRPGSYFGKYLGVAHLFSSRPLIWYPIHGSRQRNKKALCVDRICCFFWIFGRRVIGIRRRASRASSASTIMPTHTQKGNQSHW